MAKQRIWCMYDMNNKTWNIMSAADNSCIKYGTIDDIENWLDENKGSYIEEFH